MLDDPKHNDNRSYEYESGIETSRPEYSLITELVKMNSKIIDLGCGDGSLLKKLTEEKLCTGIGMELSETGVRSAQSKGLDVQLKAIDVRQDEIKDKEYDYSICNVTIQMVMYPEVLLQEMVRISRYQIISFPNFAFYRNRYDLLRRGRMPRPMLFGYTWYNTGHIHQLSMKDFEEYCWANKSRILARKYLHVPKNPFRRFLFYRFPNLFASTVIYLLKSP